MKPFPLISAIAVLFLSACDRHQWEGEDGVKELYEHGDVHAEGDAHKKEEGAH